MLHLSFPDAKNTTEMHCTDSDLESFAAAMYAAGAEDMRERAANRCNKLAMKHHQFDATYAAGKKFGALECEGDIRALPITNTKGK